MSAERSVVFLGGRDWTIPPWVDLARGIESGLCRSCGATIGWVRTTKGKAAPINQDGVSHFATCPQAASWRSPR